AQHITDVITTKGKVAGKGDLAIVQASGMNSVQRGTLLNSYDPSRDGSPVPGSLLVVDLHDTHFTVRVVTGEVRVGDRIVIPAVSSKAGLPQTLPDVAAKKPTADSDIREYN